jgi:hypothetical protein
VDGTSPNVKGKTKMIHPNFCQKRNSTMIEGLHDDPDWTRINHGNPSIKKIMVKTEGGSHDA